MGLKLRRDVREKKDVRVSMVQNDSGQLSLDFLVGFTIFLVGFIFSITMASGILVGLMSKTIDYDAVAYRTGVILVEDSGVGLDRVSLNITKNWEDIEQEWVIGYVYRAGLAVSKRYPGVLFERKIDRLVELDGIFRDEFIHEKVLFDSANSPGAYLYRYNITLSVIGDPDKRWMIGDSIPQNKATGYIKRMVKIKQKEIPPILIIDGYDPQPNDPPTIIITLPLSLMPNPLDTEYWIDPINEGVFFNLTNITPGDLTGITLNNSTHLLNGTVDNSTNGNSIIVSLDKKYLNDNSVTWGENYYFNFTFTSGSSTGGNYTYGAYMPAVLEVYIW